MRLELLHPMFVHFPLALLLMGSCLRAAAFFSRRGAFFSHLLICSWIVLSLGIFFAWCTVLTGEIACDIVDKTLCRPEATDTHSTFAYTAAFLFTAALLIDWALAWAKKRFTKVLFEKMLQVLNGLLFAAGFCILITAGYFGGMLVYEQGAAVKQCCKQKEPAGGL